MKRSTKEGLLAFVLWVAGLAAYTGSLDLPWFDFNPRSGIQAAQKLAASRPFNRSDLVVTGRDSFDFLLERLWGGCFVWLAHPIVWVGWPLLLLRRWRAATVAGCIALVLALNAPLVFQPREGPWFPARVGYHLWFASMALLACSAAVRALLFRSDPVARSEAFGRLAARHGTLAAELAELKQQVADLVDDQAATFLGATEARSRGEPGDYYQE